MRSQVQVLAGPPPIPAGQGAVGSEPRAPAASRGRAGAAPPSPPARPLALSGPSTPASGATTTTHRGRPPQPKSGSHAAVAATPRCSLLPCPQRRRQPPALRPPAWPAWSLSGHASPPSHTRPGPLPIPDDHARRGSTARVRPLGRRPSRSTARQPTGTSPRSCGGGADCLDLVPAPPLGWEEIDASGRTGADTRGAGHRTAGHRTAGHQTAGQPDPGRRPRMGGHRMLDTDRRPTPRRACWRVDTATLPDRWMPAGGSAGQTRVGRATTHDSSAARTPRGTTLLRTGLATAATVSCGCYAAIQLAPRRTAVLG
jgi:hypothetical protein